MLDVFLATMTVAVASFTLLLMPLQTASPSKKPLMLVLICLGVLSTGPLFFAFFPWLTQAYISVLPFLFYLLLPSLWFYHETLVAEQQWQWTSAVWKHLLPLPFVFALGSAIFLLPESAFIAMFFSDQGSNDFRVKLLAGAFFIAVVLWCVLSCCYMVMLLKRTVQHRNQLKNVFSNEQGKSLNWLVGVSVLIAFSWVYALAVLAVDNKFAYMGVSESGVLVLLVIIVWIMCANGIRQRPIFENNSPPIKATAQQPSTKTYEKSALTDKDLAAIAKRLTHALEKDKAHLDPELTLAKLSAIALEPSQYISQTLSQHLQTTFFDFINNARIECAKHMLVETETSVLDVALATGFNSRSSFYKAFRKFTDQTPSQYRTAHKM
ncbi:AraC family transcriptional regulator [Alteromonas sediminis]|uniref:AraC family transcriptional regulator n=1 Tax=Alteromonas sediminis TaxID=2259342 RepID=A0A3N5Y061_9ALTE|nr:AraC family transcriptional regulator [Alteromonas sediminis]RPJ65806.1 AraC family transcriptional regulator [Alteromonas sediminis]